MAAARRQLGGQLTEAERRGKVYRDQNVLEAAQARISRVFNDFPNIYVSFSGGKDSGVMLDLAAAEARRRGRRIGVLIVDLEAQYRLTIDYLHQMLDRHADVADVYWVCLPLALRNAVSNSQPQWQCWDPDQVEHWVRDYPQHSGVITDPAFFPFFQRNMEFEDFVPAFGDWYGSNGRLTACLVGIRADESINRFRTIASQKKMTHDRLQWTTWLGDAVYNAYPIYDWRTEDIWTYYGSFDVPYNVIYDRMHKAGMSIHQARICQPYGDDQRKGLWLYHLLEPETWPRVLARVDAANFGARYARTSGNVLGNRWIALPDTMPSWQAYAEHLLECLPPPTSEHYARKIAVFREWYAHKHPDLYPGGEIPDDGPENDKTTPSWRRICKTILSNDYWCTRLSFAANQTAYDKWKKRTDLLIQQRGYHHG